MHPFLSVTVALALSADPAPAAPPSPDGVMVAPSVELSAPPPKASPAKGAKPVEKQKAAPPAAAAPASSAPAAAAPVAAPPPPAAPAAPAAPVAPVGATEGSVAVQPPAAVPLAIIALDAPTELALLGRSLGEAIAQEAAKLAGFRVIAPGAVLDALGPDATATLIQCGDSAACLDGSSSKLGVERIVGGRLDRVGANYRFALVLVDVKTGAALARVTRDVPIASRRIRNDVVAAAGPLLRGEAALTGTLALQTESPGAEVRVDDKPVGKTPLEVRLPAGKHKVEVSQRGKVRVEPFWVDVPANGRADQKVRLYDIPVAERKAGEIETVVDVGKDKKRR